MVALPPASRLLGLIVRTPCWNAAPTPAPIDSEESSPAVSPLEGVPLQPLVFSAHRLLSLESPPPQAERNRAAVIGISIFDKCM